MTGNGWKACWWEFLSWWNSYNQELLVIPGYKGLKSSDRLDGNENSMFRRPLGSLKKNLITSTLNLGTSGDRVPAR